jgi:hypothetical protein
MMLSKGLELQQLFMLDLYRYFLSKQDLNELQHIDGKMR